MKENKTARERAREFVIPERIKQLIDKCNKVLGTDVELEVVPIINAFYGCIVAFAQGFTIVDCISSMLDGPSYDHNREALDILLPHGFKVAQTRYSDGGYGGDEYRFTDVVYQPSIFYAE